MPSRPARDFTILCALAAAVRVIVAQIPSVARWDGVLYARAASDLAHGLGYTQHFFADDQPLRPTAFYPPGFAAYLSLGRAVYDAPLTDRVLQITAGVMSVAATYWLARRFASPTRACLAAAIVALSPSLVALCATWLSEPLFIALQTAALAAGLRARRVSMLIVSGALFGLATLVRPIALACAVLLLAILAVRMRRRGAPLTRVATRCVAFIVAFATVVSPWVARNARELGAPVISTNGGANLLLGTWSTGRFPTGGVPSAIDCPHGMREVERDACRQRKALGRIAADPTAYLARIPRKLFDTFGYETSAIACWSLGAGIDERLSSIAMGLATLTWLFLVAAALRRVRRNPALIGLAPVLVSTATVHALWVSGDRYHMPLWPVLAVVACAVQYPARITTALPTASS